MADWLANAAPPHSMLVADLRAEIVARGEAPAGRKAALVAQLARLRPAPAGAQQEAGQMQQQQQQQQQQPAAAAANPPPQQQQQQQQQQRTEEII